MKYAIRCESKMTGIEFYILEDTKDKAKEVLDLYKDYICNGNEKWLEYSLDSTNIYCDEDTFYSYRIGTLDNGSWVLITDRYGEYNDYLKAFEFELVDEFIERY